MLFAAGLASEPDYFIVDCNGKPGGTLSVDGIDPRSLNPAFGNDGGSLNILKFIVESLLDENEFGFPEHPALCKDWWISEDGCTLSFVIREGLQWSDGQPFTIEDVRWTFEEIYLVSEMTLFGNSNFMSSAGDLPLVEVEGDTISFTWSEPNALAPRTIGLTPILPKHSLEQYVVDGTFPSAWNIGETEEKANLIRTNLFCHPEVLLFRIWVFEKPCLGVAGSCRKVQNRLVRRGEPVILSRAKICSSFLVKIKKEEQDAGSRYDERGH
jgi:peptide/nickel transport system substrate-binding protein